MYFQNSDISFNNLENEIENLIEKYNVNQKRNNNISLDSSIDDSDANKIFANIMKKKDFNVFNFSEINENIFIENHFNFINKTIMMNNFPFNQTFGNIPFENKFKIIKKVDKNVFTNKDTIMLNNKVIRMTNSVLFYFNHFYKKYQFFKFNTKLMNIKTTTV